MATHPSILAWRIPWTEAPGGPQSRGSKESARTAGSEQLQQQSIDPLLYFSDASGASSSNYSRSLGGLAKGIEGRGSQPLFPGGQGEDTGDSVTNWAKGSVKTGSCL